MPALRFETRPSSAGNATIVFGPWPRDILVRSISMNVTLDAGTAQAVPFVRMGNVDGNWLNLTPCGEDAVALGGESVQVQAYPGTGDSPTIVAGARSTVPRLFINLPYNLILPQRHTIMIGMTGGAAADFIGAVFLCIEYGARDQALPKPGGPPSSKNNP